ncbi:hypothetical protein SAMN05216464_111109 [Mucilaginibacter pineti]|uniref:Uncharacterized protein n=1 Tax=Mucilaginibacter pineti TaxID=1391627 RepID=A0A1G7H8G2_9SPHI|nr:hypothetical protein [Mucilaginibacter pineti]SDE96675.1 hypothetical protein SAMN05216464_111109 [Mucilaginibacter pineti]
MVKGIWFNHNIKGKYPFQDMTRGLNQKTLFDENVLVDSLQDHIHPLKISSCSADKSMTGKHCVSAVDLKRKQS